jgi:hypothetical protein
MDGSAVIRKPWSTPHSNSNSSMRKNANDAGVEALAARHGEWALLKRIDRLLAQRDVHLNVIASGQGALVAEIECIDPGFCRAIGPQAHGST